MNEQLQQMTDDLVFVALRFGLTEQLAGDLSVAIIEKLMDTCGGGAVYLPKQDKTLRNKLIKQRFNGNNRDQICTEFGISKSTLYRVLGEGNI